MGAVMLSWNSTNAIKSTKLKIFSSHFDYVTKRVNYYHTNFAIL